MAQQPCRNQFFNNIDEVTFNTTNIRFIVSPKGGGGFEILTSNDKPFLPIYAIVTDTSGALKPDTIANHKTFKNTFLSMYEQFYKASINYLNGLTGVPYATYVDPAPQGNPNYGQYLVKLIGNSAGTTYIVGAKRTYDNTPNLVWNFWNMIDAALTSNDLNISLDRLVKKILLESDPRFYIPPGNYLFNNTNTFETDLAAWKTAVPDLYGFFCIELNSIG